ncbi:MAG: hypothetical protein EOO90_06195 [Pedobacter sp.]|nr:MAG: hypothetical protein EOO90_06195 [Pedobacter sp.]
MVHKMLEGKVAEGNQQKMVSREVFLKVNGLLDENSHGYTMNEENVEIPLKRFVKCGHCGQPLRGYIVKKKNTYYYKCNTKACGNNKNAEVLNSRFANILEVFKIDHAKDFLTLLKKQMVATFNQLSSGKHEDLQEIQKLHKEITSKINRLEQRYIEEEIGGELYGKYKSKYDLERDEIERKLMMLSSQVSNLEKCIDLAIKFATELPLKWHSGDYHTKQQLQHLLFPLGITYDKKTDECRTEEINSVFLYLAYFQQVISKKKSGIPDLCLEYSAFSGLVAPSRIELLSKV